MVHHNKCPLCYSEKINIHFRCTDHFISKEAFEVFRCSACSFEFTNDAPDESDIDKYYDSDDYISHSDTSKGFSNKIYRFARNIMLLKKRSIIIKFSGLQRGTLLDIGCGTGHFASVMKIAGWNVKGVEINEKARNYSISKFGLEVTGPEKISELDSDSFDCITLWHVLEHFYDPHECASDLLRLLKPGGTCVIALPNCSSYDARYYGAFWAAFDVPRHLWHFNPVTFKLFSEKSGFTTKGTRTLPLDVFYISLLSERYRGSKLPFLSGMTKAKLFALLSLFKNERSSSVIYLLKKPLY